MVDVNKILGQFLGSGFAGGMAGGLASNLLTTKSGRKLGANALKLGGIAAVGGLAYTAYKRYTDSQGKTSTVTSGHASEQQLIPPPPGSAFLPEESDHVANENLGLILVRAMIAAARSDGRIDAQESQIIFQKITSLGLDSETQNLLVQEMGHPVDIDAIVSSATTPELAAEIYIASLLAIDVDTAAEKAYLAMLSARLQLPSGLVTELDSQVEAQRNELSQ